MTPLEKLFEAYKAGTVDREAAVAGVRAAFFEDLGHTTLDHDRTARTGFAEVIYGEHKSPAQIAEAFAALAARGSDVLATRIDASAFDAIVTRVPEAAFHEAGRMATLKQHDTPAIATPVAVITAGTSDLAIAEEAALTAEFFGNPVLRIRDVGVAGLHRLLARLEEIRTARVVIVVAGMEGALPSVVGGLVDKPVIAVPTSVGYGAAFGGVAALLGMLTSCADGIAVVNIDNGYGAGFLASTINRL